MKFHTRIRFLIYGALYPAEVQNLVTAQSASHGNWPAAISFKSYLLSPAEIRSGCTISSGAVEPGRFNHLRFGQFKGLGNK